MKRNSQVAESRRARRRVRFLGHQITEYAVGAALIAVGLELSRGTREEFIVIGSLLIILNLFTKGRLGAAKYIGRHLHHIADFAIIVFGAASPFFGFVRHDVRGIVAVELITLLLVFVEQSTLYVDQVTPERLFRFARAVSRPASSPTSTKSVPIQPTVNVAARQVGVVAGITKRVIKARRDARRTGNQS